MKRIGRVLIGAGLLASGCLLGVAGFICDAIGADFEDRPYAVVTATPTTMYCPQEVLVDGRRSFHGGPSHSIVSYAWDLHYDGSFKEEVAGDTASITYGELGTFTAALRLVDDSVPPRSDVATAEVTVANRPPVADAGGPYTLVDSLQLHLNAAASGDPDAACGDAIAEYAWDLDRDGFYDDAFGITPGISWDRAYDLICRGMTCGSTEYAIGLRVTDRLGLSSTAAATVTIAPRAAKLRLIWPSGGEFLRTDVTYVIRWAATGDIRSVRVSVSPDGKSWHAITPLVAAWQGWAEWTPALSEHRTVRRGWRLRLQGFRDGLPVAADATDAPFAVGPLNITAVAPGAEVPGGSTLRVSWAKNRSLFQAAYAKFGYSLDGGTSWRSVRLRGNPGEYLWKVPVRSSRTEGCRVRVELYDASGRLMGRDSGQGSFTILGGVDLTAPESGDSVYGGSNRTVLWSTRAAAAVASARLRLTLDGGATWADLATMAGNPGHCHWNVPDLPAAATSCRIEVALLDASGRTIATDSGGGYFMIVKKGNAYATAPPASITVPSNSPAPSCQIAWGASGTPGAIYELQEATDPDFLVDVRIAYAGDQLFAQIANRANGTTYYYRVRAQRYGWNPSPWVAGSNGCDVSWDDVAPGPVTGLSATVVGSGVDLAWVNPTDADFAGVRVLRRTDSLPTHASDGTLVYDGSAQSFADTGLSFGTYYYAAFAYDASMNYTAAATAIAEVVPPAALPPASITVPPVSYPSQYQVGWGASPTAGVTYELQEATDAEFVAGLRTAYSGSWLSIFLTGRKTYGITYYYRVRAVGSGWSPSPWVAAANGCTVYWEGVAPGPVTGFTATVVGNRIDLAWVKPPDSDFAGVQVLRRTDRFPAQAYDGTRVYDGPAQSFADVGLPAGVYYYAAFAYDASRNYAVAATLVVEVIPSTPLPPTSITVPAVSYPSEYQVMWGASPTEGVTYELEEATDAAFVDGVRTAYSGSWLSIFLTGRKTYGITYYYRVRALGTGRSPSAWVAATNGCTVYWEGAAPGPVTGFTAYAHGDHVHLSWVNPPDNDLAHVWIVRQTGGTPAHRYDGTLVYDHSGQSMVDFRLAPDTYYYAAYAHDASLNYSTPATATAVVTVPPLCESCHNGDGDNDGIWTGVGYDPDGGGPLPAAPNVMGDGVSPGGYDDGTWGYNVNGHGVQPGDSVYCTDCHDVSIPAGTHRDGVLNSVELKQNVNENTAHLNAGWIGASTPDWSVQLTLDDACTFQCHSPASRHRHKADTAPAPGVVRFGSDGTCLDGQGILYPIDIHISTNAPGSPADGVTSFDYAPCISCHNPHGTNLADGFPTNCMLREERTAALCAACHR